MLICYDNLSYLQSFPTRRSSDLGPRILRPWMLRVATLQFLSDLRIGPVPEAAQIAGDLDRPSVRREQREHDRFAPPADARRVGEAEQLLQLHRRGNGSIVVVVESRVAAARHGDGLRSVAFDLAHHVRRYRSREL